MGTQLSARKAARGPDWGGRLLLDADAGTILFVGQGGTADRHAHHAVQLVWSPEGEFTVTFDTAMRRRAVLIPADTAHMLDTTGRRVAILFAEPHGARGAALDRRARAAIGAELADDLRALPLPAASIRVDEAALWSDAAVTAIGADARTAPLSRASRRAIAYVEETIRGKPVIAEAARHAGLSPSRLTHVFTREVGIPFRRFVLWTRLKHVVISTRAGRDLTHAAIDGGFSDSAHLSRTFRAMFGLSPSLVLLAEVMGLRR